MVPSLNAKAGDLNLPSACQPVQTRSESPVLTLRDVTVQTTARGTPAGRYANVIHTDHKCHLIKRLIERSYNQYGSASPLASEAAPPALGKASRRMPRQIFSAQIYDAAVYSSTAVLGYYCLLTVQQQMISMYNGA